MNLTPTRLRDLDAPRLCAASGLARVYDWLYVIADDELHLGMYPLKGTGPGRLVRLFEGELPTDLKTRKALKPDLEALASVGSRLLALPSGATPGRQLGALLALEADGMPNELAKPKLVELGGLYDELRSRLGALNLEGATLWGTRFLLFNRACGTESRNAVIELDLNALRAELNADRDEKAPLRLSGSLVRAVREVELPKIAGVSLGFTDAASLGGGRVLFSAVAEKTASSIDDGPCVGSCLGLLEANGELRVLGELEGAPKVEGVAAREHARGIEALLVTDADDRGKAAELLSVSLSG